MAKAIEMIKCALLLLLIILSHNIVDVEGRSFPIRTDQHLPMNSGKTLSTNYKIIKSKHEENPRHLVKGYHQELTVADMDDVDSFRPTSPGRSPGAGH